jgi:hypothetical protein
MSKKGGVPENLTSFQKGHKSKGGRPKGSPSIITPLKKILQSNAKNIPGIKKILDEYGCKTMAQAIATKLILLVLQEGNPTSKLNALIEIINRVDGKQVERNMNYDIDVTKLSDEELKKIVEG